MADVDDLDPPPGVGGHDGALAPVNQTGEPADPEADAEVVPEVDAEVVPEADAEVVPEAGAEVVPEAETSGGDSEARSKPGGGDHIVAWRAGRTSRLRRVALLVGTAVGLVAAVLLVRVITNQGEKDELIGVVGTLDTFDRRNTTAGLGDFDAAGRWQADAGSWGISDNEAYVATPSDRGSYAVVARSHAEGAVQVRLSKVTSGAGLLFRYRGVSDHWAVIAVPQYASWAIVRVVDGKSTPVANTGLSSTNDGTTLAVRLDGRKIEVIVNGRVMKTLTDDALRDGKVGMVAIGPDARNARFDDFRMALPSGRPLPASAP